MHFSTLTVGLLAGLVTLVQAAPQKPAIPPRLFPRQAPGNATNTTTPCATVSSLYFAATGMSTPTVPAQVAYDCINSVPFNSSSGLALLDAIKPYLGWQSTTSYLKTPPAEYAEKLWPSVDVFGGIDKLKEDVQAGKFKSEYEFGWNLYRTIQAAHDGHFTYIPDSVGLIFTWGRPVALVSISEDGIKLPAVFVYEDVLQASFDNSTYNPSAVVSINGKDTAEFLEDLSNYGSLQDKDALYNNMFYELAQVALQSSGSGTGIFSGGGRGRYFYPGPDTELTFANGTTRKYENYARVLRSFMGVNTGEDLANHFFYYASSGNAAAAASADLDIRKARVKAETSKAPARSSRVQAVQGGLHREKRQASPSPFPIAGYPPAVMAQSSNIIGGYYLEGDEYKDIAVLTVPTFVTGGMDQEVDFQDIGDQFIAKAKADGKTKLIIDLSANGGGTILQGYDLFKKLFPSIEPYSANRWRAQPVLDLIGSRVSAIVGNTPRDPNHVNATVRDLVTSPFNYQTDVDLDLKHFDSWAQKYGPHEANGDNFTTLHRWDLNDPLITDSSGGIYVTGYGPRANFTEQPFQPADIVLLTDGYCASTCAIFAEFMRTQAGVRVVTMGGRPNTEITQAVGGVKGTNNFQWGYIQYMVQTINDMTSTSNRSADYNSTVKPYYNDLPFYRASGTPSANVRDGIGMGDVEEVPLQFRVEEADCRIFYTAGMTTDVTTMWKAVADSAWEEGRGGTWCIAVGGKSASATQRRTMRKRDLSGAGEITKRFGGKREFKKGARELFNRLRETLNVHTHMDAPVTVHGYMAP